MDEMQRLRELRAGLPPARPAARAYARGRLVARVEEGERERPRRHFAWLGSRPRLLAAAGLATALVVASVAFGAFSGDGRVEPAVAEVLRQTASVAATADISPETPGPGQLLYARTRSLGLWSWSVDGRFVGLGTLADGTEPFRAIVSTEVETWTSADGMERVRETLGEIEIPSTDERNRWEAAGSPLPGKFDPGAEAAHADAFGYLHATGGRILELRRGVVDLELGRRPDLPEARLPDASTLPTEPRALRRAVRDGEFATRLQLRSDGSEGEAGEVFADPTPLNTEETIFGIWGILSRSTFVPTSTAVRAAAFAALAEMPGIELKQDVTDLSGRSGDAISYLGEDSGLRHELIFDPVTSRALAERSILIDPRRSYVPAELPAGTVVSEVDYLESSLVDAGREAPAESNR